MFTPDSFGRRLRALRLQKGFTQEDLAFYAGTCSAEVSRLERGLGNPQLLTILSLAHVLEVEPADLLKEESE